MASEDRPKLIVTTGNDVQGHEIDEYLGVVRGIVVRSHVDLAGIPRGVQEHRRRQRTRLTRKSAKPPGRMPSSAWPGRPRKSARTRSSRMRYDATEFQQGTTEVLAYGTAVTLK